MIWLQRREFITLLGGAAARRPRGRSRRARSSGRQCQLWDISTFTPLSRRAFFWQHFAIGSGAGGAASALRSLSSASATSDVTWRGTASA